MNHLSGWSSNREAASRPPLLVEFPLCMPLLVIWTVSLRQVLQGPELSAVCVLCKITIGKGGEGRDGVGGAPG